MKNSSLCVSVLAAIATGTFLPGAVAQAQPPRAAGRIIGSEDGAARPTHRVIRASPRRAALAPAGSDYPHYRLIDLGTLGGPESGVISAARTMNRDQVIGSSDTAVPDPTCSLSCYIDHAIVRIKNGSILELPPPHGIDPATNYTFAGDITANGLLGGFVSTGELDPLTDFPQLRPVVWGPTGRGVYELGTFGGNSGAVNMLNGHGAAVGSALNVIPENPDFASWMFTFPAATQARAFLWEGSELQDLGTLGGNDAMALAINESWTIFGMSYTDTVPNDTTGLPTVHPFLWKDGQMQDLGSLGGTVATPGSFSEGPWGPTLNEDGQAVGNSYLPGDRVWHAFLWEDGTMIDLGTLGGRFSEPRSINEQGVVVGRADYSPLPYHHAVVWRDGGIHDLGVVAPCRNSTANAVNVHGVVVGGLGACTDDPDDLYYYGAFVWRNGSAMADLDSLVVPPSDLHLGAALDINEQGEIAAQALTPTGENHGVLLVPLDR